MMDLPQGDEDEDDSDRTKSYTPPPLDITTDHSSSETENQTKDRMDDSFRSLNQHSDPIKVQSIIVLDDSFEQKPIRQSYRPSTHFDDRPSHSILPHRTRCWNCQSLQSTTIGINGSLLNNELPDGERENLYSIPDIDIPSSSPPSAAIVFSMLGSNNCSVMS